MQNNTPKVNVAVKPDATKREKHFLEKPKTSQTTTTPPLSSNGFNLTEWANQVLAIAPATAPAPNAAQPAQPAQHNHGPTQ